MPWRLSITWLINGLEWTCLWLGFSPDCSRLCQETGVSCADRPAPVNTAGYSLKIFHTHLLSTPEFPWQRLGWPAARHHSVVMCKPLIKNKGGQSGCLLAAEFDTWHLSPPDQLQNTRGTAAAAAARSFIWLLSDLDLCFTFTDVSSSSFWVPPHLPTAPPRPPASPPTSSKPSDSWGETACTNSHYATKYSTGTLLGFLLYIGFRHLISDMCELIYCFLPGMAVTQALQPSLHHWHYSIPYTEY